MGSAAVRFRPHDGSTSMLLSPRGMAFAGNPYRQFVWAPLLLLLLSFQPFVSGKGSGRGLAPPSTPSLLTLPVPDSPFEHDNEIQRTKSLASFMQTATNKTCIDYELSAGDCYAVLQFYILHYVSAKDTEEGGGDRRTKKFAYRSNHHVGNTVFPLRLWLKGIPKRDVSPSPPPNACLTHSLINPSNSIFDKFPLTIDAQQFQVHMSLTQNPFETTDEICTRFALLHDDCITLLGFILNKYAIGLQKSILEECNGIFQLDDDSTQNDVDVSTWNLHAYLWPSPETWQQEVADIDGKQNVRIEYPTSRSVLVTSNEDDGYLRKVIQVSLGHGGRHDAKLDVDHIRVSLDNQPIYFHDHIHDVRLVHMDLSLLTVGTHDLKVQVGKSGEQGTRVNWLPVVRVVFDVVPPSVYHPTRETMKSVFQTPDLDEGAVDSSNAQLIGRPLEVAYMTSIGGLDGQSRVLISTALRLDKSKFKVTFLSTKELKPPKEMLEQLEQNDIPYLHVPVKIKGDLFWNVFNGSMVPLLDIVSKISSIQEIENPEVRETVGLMVATLRGFDILTFTNIQARKIEDSIIANLARIAKVPIRICDPGNLQRALPTLNSVTHIVVPSYRARKHWEDMGVAIPIKVVWPGATDYLPVAKANNAQQTSDTDFCTNITRNNDGSCGVFNIVFVGRLHIIKSPGIFVRVASRIKEHFASGCEEQGCPGRKRPKFHIIGDGFLKNSLEALSVQLGLSLNDDISFHGRLAHDEVLSFLKDKPAHMLVHTSLLNETFGLVLVESMAVKVPVVTFGVGGTADFLAIDDKHSCVARETTVDSLVASLLDCMDKRIDADLGQRAYEVVRTLNLTVPGMVKRFENFYQEAFFDNLYPRKVGGKDETTDPDVIDHRHRMTPYERDLEGVWSYNMALKAWRDEKNKNGVHALHPLANKRLRNHRGIPFNECCCGLMCKITNDNAYAKRWITSESLSRKLFLPFLKQRGKDEFAAILESSSNSNSVKDVSAADNGGKSRRPAFTYPKTVGPYPVNAFVRGNFLITSLHKLEHDIEQLKYLIEAKKLPNNFVAVVENYTRVYQIESNKSSSKEPDRYFFLSTAELDMIGTSYNQLLYFPLQTLTRVSPTALNPLLNYHAIEEDYLASENAPGFTVIDQLLSLQALHSLRNFLLEATIWFDVKEGYLGAYHDEGLNGPLLRQLEEELKFYMPRIFKKEYPLVNMWSYKCDQRYVNGLNVHADAAKVNFNLWLTEDDASLDKSNGGLVVYLTPAPPIWDFKQYNALASKPAIYKFIEQQNARAVRIPFRTNRAVVFHSQLFHESDRFTFKKGYKNRRINLTLLFGKRDQQRG